MNISLANKSNQVNFASLKQDFNKEKAAAGPLTTVTLLQGPQGDEVIFRDTRIPKYLRPIGKHVIVDGMPLAVLDIPDELIIKASEDKDSTKKVVVDRKKLTNILEALVFIVGSLGIQVGAVDLSHYLRQQQAYNDSKDLIQSIDQGNK